MDFTFTQRLPVAREPLFKFHEDPENLRVLLEGWEGTTVLTTDGHIRPGARTGVLERMGPFRIRFVFEHFLLEPPERFGERQVRGIFRVFKQVHEFQECETGATVIRDRLEVQLPVWLGARRRPGSWSRRGSYASSPSAGAPTSGWWPRDGSAGADR